MIPTLPFSHLLEEAREVRELLKAGFRNIRTLKFHSNYLLFPATLNPEYMGYYEVFVFFTRNTLPIKTFFFNLDYIKNAEIMKSD